MIDVSRDKLPEPWIANLRAWGLGGLASSLLRHGGPLPLVGAQALYFAAPMLDVFGSGDWLVGLANTLEDPTATQALADRLAEGT